MNDEVPMTNVFSETFFTLIFFELVKWFLFVSTYCRFYTVFFFEISPIGTQGGVW